jgi:hypothetical protein
MSIMSRTRPVLRANFRSLPHRGSGQARRSLSTLACCLLSFLFRGPGAGPEPIAISSGLQDLAAMGETVE